MTRTEAQKTRIRMMEAAEYSLILILEEKKWVESYSSSTPTLFQKLQKTLDAFVLEKKALLQRENSAIRNLFSIE